MAGFRFFVLTLCTVCLCVGCASSQGDGTVEVASFEPPEPNPVVLNGVEICGPIYEALEYLGPKDEDGRLDMSQFDWEMAWPGHPVVYLPVPLDAIHSETLQKATSVRLDEFEGRVVSVSLLFERGREENTEIWNTLFEVSKTAPGPPVEEADMMFYRERGRLHSGGIHGENMETVMFSMTCLPLKDDFLAEMDAAAASDKGSSPAVNPEANDDEQMHEWFLGKTVFDVILISGQPVFDPVMEGSNRVGMFFDNRGFMDTPTDEWVWFVDGKSAYVGWEFPPPFSPDDVVRNFFAFREELIESLGEPDESIGGWMDERFQARWIDGNFETVLTLEDAERFPRFLIEFIDREKLEVIDFDLRPDRETVPQIAMLQPRREPHAAEK